MATDEEMKKKIGDILDSIHLSAQQKADKILNLVDGDEDDNN